MVTSEIVDRIFRLLRGQQLCTSRLGSAPILAPEIDLPCEDETSSIQMCGTSVLGGHRTGASLTTKTACAARPGSELRIPARPDDAQLRAGRVYTHERQSAGLCSAPEQYGSMR